MKPGGHSLRSRTRLVNSLVAAALMVAPTTVRGQTGDVPEQPGSALPVSVLADAPLPQQEPGHDPGQPEAPEADGHGDSRITDEHIPLQELPDRPKPLLELGSPFLGTGRIGDGFRIPGGAVWTPHFLLFGTFRSGVNVLDDETTRTTQWANRLDLFGNLYLTATERFVVGVRPLDESVNGARFFSGYTSLSPDPLDRSGYDDHLNFGWDTISHLFFEGDLGELFPAIDRRDSRGLDIGFAVGRQPIVFQEGLLINDFIDAVGITQTNFKPSWAVNLRLTGLFGWNQINRNTPLAAEGFTRNAEAGRSQLVGAFTEIDIRPVTVAVDAIYVRSDAFENGAGVEIPAPDGIYLGVGVVGRPGSGAVNTAVRIMGSLPAGEDVDEALSAIGNPASRGVLAFGEFSWTPHHSHNYFYANGFYAAGEYRAAALDPRIPGPLARAGILFAGPGLGSVPGALSSTASDAAGGALGHQRFFGHTRQQLLLEAAGRYSTKDCESVVAACDAHGAAAGARYQLAVGRRGVIVVDGFVVRDWLRGAAASTGSEATRTRVGGRVELLVKF